MTEFKVLPIVRLFPELIARLTDIKQRSKPMPSRKKLVSLSTPERSHPTPTVEGVLSRAFTKARQIDPDTGLDGCGWERCGRTDVGVSTAGQVVSLWVRGVFQGLDAEAHHSLLRAQAARTCLLQMPLTEPPQPPDRELQYVSILNCILPPTIRVLAWFPVSPSSARFKCKYSDWCGVTEQAGHDDQLYVLALVGNVFLYHRVRHIMAVLFLVGTGLEPPSIIPKLTNSNGSESARTDRKAEYQIADAPPLMFDGDVNTNVADEECENNPDRETGSPGMERHSRGLVRQIHFIYQRPLIRSALEGHFLSAVYFSFSQTALSVGTIPRLPNNTVLVIGVPLGGGTYRKGVKYLPLLSRKRSDHVDVANARSKNGSVALISTAEMNGNE
ncbi:pseudouridine synthase [Pisolithus microcarpus]|nr:pseudouridine synthase [Pisolithus microcarpus]